LEAENLVMDGSIRPPAPPSQQASLIKERREIDREVLKGKKKAQRKKRKKRE
jgi:hypothetical protein